MDLLRQLLPRRAAEWSAWVRRYNPAEADEAIQLAAQVVANVLVSAPQNRAEARRYLELARRWAQDGRAGLLWVAEQSSAHGWCPAHGWACPDNHRTWKALDQLDRRTQAAEEAAIDADEAAESGGRAATAQQT
jgi:hypothetical protein